jgi:hypothetical protein
LPKKTTAEFIEQAKKTHGKRFGYDKVDYQGYHIKVIITCQVHGDIEQTPSNHLGGKGCQKCGRERSRKAIGRYFVKNEFRN